METSFPIAHKRMLAYEGGYSNHPADPGGVTLNGIIQRVYDAWRLRKGLPRKTLTKAMLGTARWIAERDTIYRENYWLPPRCPELPAGVDAAIYDYAVNSGIGRASKVLQRLVGVPDDGRIGPATLAAVAKRDPKALVDAICAERLAFLKRLKTWPVFGIGWARRVADVKSYAGALAVATPAPTEMQITVPIGGRGEVPEPKAAKNAIKGGAPAGSLAAGGTWLDWMADHPIETGLIAVAIVGAALLGIYALNRWRQVQQEAPTPGIGVVPEMT